MKRKIMYLFLMVIVAVGCFYIGRLSFNPADAGYISTADIIDWNTNGEEISITTKDGLEWYAYKSADIYTRRCK